MAERSSLFDPVALLEAEPNVELTPMQLPKSFLGVYSRRGDDILIGYSASLNAVMRRCVIAHEAGHYFLGHNGSYFFETHKDWIALSKQEYDAMVWAADRLVDTNELLSFRRIRPYAPLEDVLEYFEIDKEFLFFKWQRLVGLGIVDDFFMP